MSIKRYLHFSSYLLNVSKFPHHVVGVFRKFSHLSNVNLSVIELHTIHTMLTSYPYNVTVSKRNRMTYAVYFVVVIFYESI